MALRVIGAGNGRTGTHSLKLALERLLGAPCYHMMEVGTKRRDHIEIWHRAALKEMPDWEQLFRGYAAAVDLPASMFWRELMAAYPEAPVLLSLRDPESWWESAHATIFRPGREASPEFAAMIAALAKHRFTPEVEDKEAALAAYNAHNAAVREEVPRERLVIWNLGDGWEPICKALDLAVPDEPFPNTNSTAEFRAR
jgi:hypothetical protein